MMTARVEHGGPRTEGVDSIKTRGRSWRPGVARVNRSIGREPDPVMSGVEAGGRHRV